MPTDPSTSNVPADAPGPAGDRDAAVTVRPATAADVPAVAELAALTFPLACPPDSPEADQQAFIAAVLSAERFAGYLADPTRDVLVSADRTGRPVGYTMLVEGEPSDEDVRDALTIRPTIELSKCYVHPGHHGSGVAGALMAASLEAARERGALGMWLGVNQLNARAQAFYTRSGFAVVGTKHFQVGGRLEDDYVLERPL
ncbi:GNAT family N-acetyltransferase [Cellulomonas soli]|uniref:N-acetyltransferase n=1 Tax=Cellulomonas soli TaxID=931535 RepID=A0A512PG67_9CELL|nr:GNAT family N-acetyltransferase [Cellulomonas soli]NYI58064.1 tRNA (guanine37-N1)-methyltransferase [Cellulomonas soli]GEP70199.1 N-acetyltransferase [Cellulomonas soli]